MRIFQTFDQRASFLHPDLFLAGRTAARLAAAVTELCNTRLHDGVVDANPPRAAAAAAPPPGTQREEEDYRSEPCISHEQLPVPPREYRRSDLAELLRGAEDEVEVALGHGGSCLRA